MIEIEEDSPFTIHNIPYGVIQLSQKDQSCCCATAVGKFALNLAEYARLGHLYAVDSRIEFICIFSNSTLNAFAALPRHVRTKVREQIQADIMANKVEESCLIPLEDVTMLLPMSIGGFSDFYCSLEHCRNCAPMSKDMMPTSWWYTPTAYNGRVSSIVPSPSPIRRPKGVYNKGDENETPMYGPSQAVDFELEMGFFVSKPVPHGQTMEIADAPDHIFGFVLLNDWSARDIQLFEMNPLGPFNSKGFGTSISPWIVSVDALERFQCPPQTPQNPPPLAHLCWENINTATFDIQLSVSLLRDKRASTLSHSNLKYMYWTPYQELTHHASAMCGMRTGDLCGSGTISGDRTDVNGNKTELGCLYEANAPESTPIHLSDGTRLSYLEDGDEVILEAWCLNESGQKLGFGQCRGKLLHAYA